MKRSILASLVALALIACNDRPTKQPPPVDAELARYVLDEVPADIPHKTFIDFEGKVHLVGYAVAPEGVAAPGTTVKVTLYWKSVAPLHGGWQLFTHVVDPSRPRGTRITNLDNDGPLRQQVTVKGQQIQRLAPVFWQPDHVYVDEQSFEVPKDTRASLLTYIVGIWQDAKLVRRPHADGAAPIVIPSARLDVLSGATDGDNGAIVMQIPTGVGSHEVAKKTEH